MFTFLLILLILDSIVLIPTVLLQSGKGGGLASMGGPAGGSDTLFGTRQAATLLTKMTWWTGGLFVGLAFALSILSSRPERGGSVLRRELQGSAPTAPATAPAALPGARPATPAPATPAPATPAPKQ
ncbi:MAG TPA: preprotein translocase subunit SecG [Longimicrobium sp.]